MKKWIVLLLLAAVSVVPAFPKADLPAAVAEIVAAPQTVYVTKTGKKFHPSSCHHLRASKIKTDRTKALRAGYTACKVCKP